MGLDQAAVLGRHGGDRRSEEARGNQGCNATLKRGTADYWEARLSRDRLAEARAVYCAGVNDRLPQT